MLKKMLKYRIYLITIVLLSVIIFSISLYVIKSKPNSERFARGKDQIAVLMKASYELKRIWQNGDLDSLWKNQHLDCTKLLGDPALANDAYLRCNPDFIQCYFEHMNKSKQPHLTIHHKNIKQNVYLHRFKNHKYYQLVTKSIYIGKKIPPMGIMVELALQNNPKNRLRIILKDVCSEVLLPPRIYAFGPMPKDHKKDWKWDNFNRSILVDKNLVSNRDIREWQDHDPTIRLGHFSTGREQLSNPATTLTIVEMKKFCQFRGKELLSAHVFDAATFLPMDLSNPRPNLIIRSPWPFSRVSKEGHLYKAQKDENYEVTNSDCAFAYTADCLKYFQYKNYNDWALSFTGIAGSLGGYMEVFDNISYPDQNLKASSFYFPASSLVHRLAHRSYWDGVGFHQSNFRFDEKVDSSILKGVELEVAFRCMRQSDHD